MRLRLTFGALVTMVAAGSAVAQGDPLADGADARVVFERALTAEDREEWEVLVGLGLAAGGYEGTDARAIGRVLLVRWLTERWIAEVGAPDRRMVEDAIAEGNRRYLYVYDAGEDRYRRDSAGDLQIKGIAGHGGPGGEREAWLTEVGDAKETALTAWRHKTRATYLEVLASEGLDEHGAVARALAASIAEYEDAAARDMTALMVRHELQFSYLRLRDTLSARRAGEGGSARAITDRLVGAAERELGEATEALEAAIPGEHTAAAVRVSADEWRESFRAQFEAGLAAWGEAEDRFVAQRLKWETDAGVAYRAAEAEWDQAFRRFGEAREAWLAKMNTLLISAETRRRETLERFGQDVRSELTDLAGAHAKEQAARRDEARTYLAAFKQAVGVLEMAQKNITYLTKRRDDLRASITDMRARIEVLRKPEYDTQRSIDTLEAIVARYNSSNNTSSSNNTTTAASTTTITTISTTASTTVSSITIGGITVYSLGSARRKLAAARERKAEAIAAAKPAIDALRGQLPAPRSELETIETELAYWQGHDGNGGLRQQFRGIRDQARDQIRAFAARIGGGLADTSSIEQERHRLRTLIAMLHDERSIARAVVRYADDTSSDRHTRAQTAERLIAARDAMRRAETAYRAAITELQRRSSQEVAAKEGDLSRQQRALAGRHRVLADAKQHLQNAIDTYRLQNTKVFDRLLGAIDASNKTFLDTTSANNTQDYRDLVGAYAGDAWKALVAERIARSNALAAHLASGASDATFTSTQELTDYLTKLGKVELTGSAAEFTTHLLTTVGLAPDDPNLKRLADAYTAFVGSENERARAVARLEVHALYDKLVAAAEYRLLVRRRALALVRGHYAQDGTRRTVTAATVPVILRPERATRLEERIELSAARAELTYRSARLSVQVGVNTALTKAARAEATWRAASGSNRGSGTNRQRAATVADAIKQALNANDPVEGLAFTLYRNGKAALDRTALAELTAARDHLDGADTSTVAAINAALADRRVAAAGRHTAQFTGGGANLLDRLVRTQRRARDEAAAERAALNSYGRAGHAWLQVRVRDQVRKLTTTIGALTTAVDTAVAAKRAVDPEHFADAYRALTKDEAPNALLDTIGLYARALAAEGHLTALSPTAISALDVADPTTAPERTGAERAGAHRRLAAVLQPPGGGVTLAHLAGRGLPTGVAQPDALTAARYRSMLDAALDALGLHAQFRTNGDLAAYTRAAGTMQATGQALKRLRTAFIDAEARYRDHLAQRVTVGTQRQTFLFHRERYYDTTITGLQNQVNTHKGEVEAQEARVRTALAAFTTAATRYQAQSRAVAAAERRYQSARLALHTAEAIDDYARSGSVDSAPNPREALAAAGRKLRAARTALAALTRLIARGEAVPQRDARYQTLLEAEGRQLQAAQEFALTADRLRAEVSTLGAQMQTAKSNSIDLIRARGKYGTTGDWVPANLDMATIRANRLHGRAAEFGNAAAYFNGDADTVARKYAADFGSWILGIQEQGGSEFMQRMSIALMYELGTGQSATGPFQDKNGALKSHLTPHVLDTPQADRLITLSKYQFFGFFDTNGSSKGAAMHQLFLRTAGTYHAVKATAEYAFFRLLMASGNHGAQLQQIVNDDIQQRAVQSLIQDGQHYRSKLWWWWQQGRRNDLDNAIGAMPQTTGAPERDRFLAKGQLTHEIAAWRTASARLTALRDVPPTLTTVQAQITRAGGTVNPAVTAAIRHVLTGGSAADRTGIVSVVDAAAQRITGVLATTNRDLVARAGELTAEAQPLQHTYLTTLGSFLDGNATRAELNAALAARYRRPAYDAADALTARIAGAEAVTPRTTGGELAQLRMLIDHTLAAGVQQDADARLRLVHQYTIDQEQLQRGIDRTKAATIDLITRAHAEWNRAFTRLAGRRKRWQGDTAERYHKRAELWNRRHAALTAGRSRWLETTTRTGMVAGTRALAAQWDLEATALIADAESVVIPSFTGHTPDLSAIVREATDDSVLGDLIERARSLQSRARDTNVVVAAYLPQINTRAAEARVARTLTGKIFDQVTQRAAMLNAIRARELFATQLDAIDSGITSANQDLHGKLANRMEAAGYHRDGALWRRQAIIGSTVLGGNEWETHQVDVYRDFIAPGFSGRTDLSNHALKGLSGTAIAVLVDQATEEMARYQVLIFGRSEQQKKPTTKDGKQNKRYVEPAGPTEFRNALARVLREAQAAWKTGANSKRTADTEGLFNYHVGYDPVMEGESIKQAGYGQLGVIMGAFLTNEARMHRGHAALKAPIYRKPLWDDDADNDGKSDSLLPAPNLTMPVSIGYDIVAGVAGVAVTAVAGNVAGGAVSTAIGLVDDAIFTGLDVATGYRNAKDAWYDFGVKAATTAVANMVSAGFSSIGSAGASLFSAAASTTASTAVNSGTSVVASALGNSLKAIGQSTLTKLANTAITTAAYGGKWDKAFADLGSWEQWSGTVTAGIRGFSRTMLAGTDLAGFDSEDAGHVNNVAGFGANTIAGGFEFATTGAATFNIASIKGVGATAITFAQDRGISAALLSQAGHQLNFSAAMRGFGTFAFNNAVRRYERTGDIDVLKGHTGTTDAGVALRSNYSFGDEAAVDQAWRIADGTDLLRVGGKLSDDGGDNHLGLTTIENGRRVVHLATLGKKGDIASQLAAGTTLQWEAHRDGRNNGFTGQWRETMHAAASSASMAYRIANSQRYGQQFSMSDQQVDILTAMVEGGNKGLAMHVAQNYDFTSGDNWRLTEDGGLEFDGDGWLKTADGQHYINEDGSLTPLADGPDPNTIGAEGIETGLLNILNGLDSGRSWASFTSEQRHEAQQLMLASGMMHTIDVNDPSNTAVWMWNRQGVSIDTIGGKPVRVPLDVRNANEGIIVDAGLQNFRQKEYDPVEVDRAEAFRNRANTNAAAEDVQKGYVNEHGTGGTWCNVKLYRDIGAVFGEADNYKSLLQPGGIDNTRANHMGLNLAAHYPRIPSAGLAQDLANANKLVAAAWIHPDTAVDGPLHAKPGHVASVVPWYGVFNRKNGPRVSQAGAANGEMWASRGFGNTVSDTRYYLVLKDTVLKTIREENWWPYLF